MKVWLDDLRDPLYHCLDGTGWVWVKTVEEVIALLQTNKVTHLSLDNDLGLDQLEGHVIIEWMINNDIWPIEEVWVHSQNIVRSKFMKEDIERYFYRKKK